MIRNIRLCPVMLGILLFFLAGCEEESSKPVHFVGEKELPVTPVPAKGRVNRDEFRLLQLPDGHDYWFYAVRSSDRGYSGLTHAPDCAKCKRLGTLSGQVPPGR